MPQITQHILKTTQGFELSLVNYGARVHSVKLPHNKQLLNVALSYQDINDYIDDKFYLGATIGRFSNRIQGGRISLSNKIFKLPLNDVNHPNTLHGGHKGFDKCFWEVSETSDTSIEFRLLSPHLDQGFPGNLNVRARYTVEGLGFSVEYTATCDQDTIVNLCNHTYFNLEGSNSTEISNIADHQLLLTAGKFLPLTENNVPNGIIQSVADTVFNFSKSELHPHGTVIAETLGSKHPQIKLAGGLDHTFVNNMEEEKKLRKIAQLYSKKTNITLNVSSTQAALHVYTGNYLDNQFNKHAGICFETQGFPDSPNHENFPSAVLKAGDTYSHKTRYVFSLC